MHNLPLAQELDDVAHVGVVSVAQDVVVRRAGFLLCRQVFVQVRQRVAGDGERLRIEGHAVRVHRVNGGRVVDKIGVVPCRADLLGRKVPRELIHQRAHHFQVGEFFRTNVC